MDIGMQLKKLQKTEKIGSKNTIGLGPSVINTAIVHVKDFDTIILVDDEGNSLTLGKQYRVSHTDGHIEVGE